MKNLIVATCLSIFAVQSFASSEKLLSCNPPMGSGLQEVKVTKLGTQYFRSELNFAGSLSAPTEINQSSWLRKDMRWTSRNGGNIHLFQVTENSKLFWRYEAQGIGMTVHGFCEE